MRYLTKSRYKLGLECPNKLFYTKKKEYADTKVEDPFLEALASGGFQVEELAKLHYPEGILIEDKKSDGSYDYEEKIVATDELLRSENVVIFEAAFRYQNLFIRVDILEKKGNKINLIEVKAKSFDSSDSEYEFIGKRGGLVAGWKYYLFDVAFQKYVIEKAYEAFTVTPYLMLADKHKTTNIDGLNQLFRVSKRSDNRTGVECKLEKLDNPAAQSVLTKVNVSVPLQGIESGQHRILEEYDFEASIQVLSDTYENDRYFGYPLKFPVCKQCEFKTEEETAHLRSGFQECFSKKMGWTDDQFNKPNAFEIWDFRSWKSLEEQGKLLLEELDDSDFGNINAKAGSMSRVERQLIQREKSLAKDSTPYLLKEELKAVLDSWQFPLNFIDFETSTAPLPFFVGQKPYEQVAFQFSHHIYHEDGSVEHAGQYINVNAGEFPNYEFLRALKASLGRNEGSIFMFSNHENTVLNQVMVQLLESQEADKNDLIAFAQSITRPTGNSSRTWNGDRAMIDLCKVIKDYYYNPFTKGSNSIKKVLPAVFESSAYIRKKYTKPIGEIGLNSLNFDAGKVWLNIAGATVQDPYKTLPPLFEEWDDDFELVSEMEDISDGGAAMTAYGKLQYTDMSEAERNAIRDALLRYCELDTLAMVMIYEHLREVVQA